MFVLYGINRTTKRPERVTASDSRPTLRRMWTAYESAALGDLDGDADDVEVKRGTDRTHVAALSREIARAQRAHRLAGGTEDDDDEAPADRDAKPDNVVEPAAPPAEDDEPEDDLEPARAPALEISDDVPPDRPVRVAARVTASTKLPPLHRHACDEVPCPVADCGVTSAPYSSVLPAELRCLCKRHRDNVQANRSKGMTVADALETVLANGRARLARTNATARAVEAPTPDAPPLRLAPPAPTSDGEPCVLRIAPQTEPRFVDLNGIFDRLDALATPAAGDVVHPEALTRADLAAVLREFRDGVRHAFDVAIARLGSPR